MWSPYSWKSKDYAQNISYNDPIALENNLKKLSSLPPLVSVREINRLRSLLAEAAMGNRFLLQGGDCAEMFDYASEEPIQRKLKVLLQMSLILTWGGNTPVVRIARMGGQYAKPRSNPTEIVDGIEIPTFKGEIINGTMTNGSIIISLMMQIACLIPQDYKLLIFIQRLRLITSEIYLVKYDTSA